MSPHGFTHLHTAGNLPPFCRLPAGREAHPTFPPLLLPHLGRRRKERPGGLLCSWRRAPPALSCLPLLHLMSPFSHGFAGMLCPTLPTKAAFSQMTGVGKKKHEPGGGRRGQPGHCAATSTHMLCITCLYMLYALRHSQKTFWASKFSVSVI